MHTALIRPGGINNILTQESLNLLIEILGRLQTKFDEVNDLLNNRLFKSRRQNIGYIPNNIASKMSYTGPMIRAGGFARDSRS